MNKILKKLRSRNLQTNFKQFLSVILIVFLSVTLLSGFIVNSHILDKSINKYFEEANLADLWVYTDKITAEDEQFYVSNKIVSEKRFYFESTAKFEEQNVSNMSKIYVSDGMISSYIVESGRAGCLIDKNVVKNNDISMGMENVKIDLKYQISDTVVVPITIDCRITGTMSYVESADTYSSWPIVFSEELFLVKINEALENAGVTYVVEEIPFNQVVIKTDNIAETKQKIENYYQTAESELFYIFDRTSIESVVLLNSEVEQSKKMIYIFPIIFLVVAVLVILTTINQLVLQEKSKIGTLKCVGVPDKKILNHYSSYGAYLCAIGSLLGLVAGPIVIPQIMFVKYDLVYSIPEDFVKLGLPVHWMLLVFVGIVLLGYLISFLACYEILHKRPIACLKQEIKINIKSGKKQRLKQLPIPLKMAVRNIRIKPVRTIMATLGIAGCVALLLCGFGIGDTLNHSKANDLGGLIKYDVSTTYTSPTFEADVENVSGIVSKEKYLEFYVEATNGNKIKNIALFEIKENSEFIGVGISGDGVCLSKAVADDFDIKVGDKLTVSLGGKSVELTVSSLKETSFYNGVYVCKSLGFDEGFATKYMLFKNLENPENLVENINKINGTNTATTFEEQIDSIDNKISSINLMTTTLKVFAIFLAVVVLMNLIFLILKERIKEIATMKVIGQNIFTITLSLFFEVLIMALIGMPIGMLLGFPLLVLVLTVNKVEVMNFLYHINFVSFVWSLFIILATICLVVSLVLIRVKKVNMIESLKSVE